MKKNLLTSGEFTSLRGVNLNSLRYYEKMDLLKPAWVDPQTRYRYYRLEQLSDLDTVLFFIEVGLPLKTLHRYLDGQGSLDQGRVLRDGRRAMREKIAQMEAKLAVTEFDLRNLEENRWSNQQEGLFSKAIAERTFFARPFEGAWEDPVARERAAMELFRRAQEEALVPVFPAGILARPAGDSWAYWFFVQVLRPHRRSKETIVVPAGTYRCLQVQLRWDLDIPGLIEDQFPHAGPGPVIMVYILRESRQFASRYVEIQAPEKVAP